jgi:hypothetical protein
MNELDTLHRGKIVNSARPEWVMLGAQWDGPGVLLLASRTLTHAELDFRAKRYDFRDWAQFLTQFRPELTLAVHMHDDYVLVFGESYVECLATLLRQWTPDNPAVPLAIEAAT